MRTKLSFTLIAAVVARVVVACAQVVVVKLVAGATGIEGLALFILIMGFTPWLSLLDFGFGQTAQNEVAFRDGRPLEQRALAAACCRMGLSLIMIFIPVWCVVVAIFGPIFLGRLATTADQVPILSLGLAGICMLVNAIGGIAWRVRFGEGNGWIAIVVNGTFTCIALLAVACSCHFRAPLPVIVIAWLLPMALASLFATLRYVRMYSMPLTVEVKGRARKFWIYSAIATCTLYLDYLILSYLVPAKEIVIYGVIQRMLGFALSLHASGLSAISPRWSSIFASAHNEDVWISIKAIVVLGLCGGLAAMIFLIMFGQFSISFIVGHDLSVDVWQLVLAGGYLLVRIWVDTMSVALSAINDTGVLLFAVGIQALLSIAGMLWLVPQFGINGTFLALILSFIFTVAWMLPRRLKTLLSPQCIR